MKLGTQKPSLTAFTRAYLECALWSSNDERGGRGDGGTPLDENYSLESLAPETLLRAIKDCAAFEEANAQDFVRSLPMRKQNEGSTTTQSEYAGHDFWLTRNGHGAGFWDGDWSEPQASRLTAASKAFGSIDLYVGDDGRLYFS